MLLHSFGGSLEVARECSKFDAYFSFSGYFLHPRKAKIREAFAQFPTNRILAETDAPDMPLPEPSHHLAEINHPANLTIVYRELSKICQIDPDQITRNCQDFLGEEI